MKTSLSPALLPASALPPQNYSLKVISSFFWLAAKTGSTNSSKHWVTMYTLPL